MSWKAAKALGILSQHYPLPPPTIVSLEPNIKATTSTHTPPSTDDLKLRSFIGLVNQLCSSTNTVATLLAPFRPLLSTKNEFVWSPSHDTTFLASKESLIMQPVLSFFDITKPTRLSTDTSRQGIGNSNMVTIGP